MQKISWNEDLSVNILELDAHHKKLVGFLNEINSCLNTDQGEEIINGILKEMLHYTIYHFFAEEHLMEGYDYPEYEAHKLEHLDLVKKTLKLLDDFSLKRLDAAPLIIDFLHHWIVNHIMISDKKYSSFLNERGVY